MPDFEEFIDSGISIMFNYLYAFPVHFPLTSLSSPLSFIFFI